MPVSLPENKSPLTVDMIRQFLRDVPDKNILLDDIEFTDQDINFAIQLATSMYNTMPPATNLESAQIPIYILLLGVCYFLLNSEGIRQMRNQIVTQDGNIAPVGIDEKEGLYRTWADNFKQEFTYTAGRYKTSQNMEACYGNFGSGYAWVGRWNH